jgi:hypothetical protein
MPSVTGNWKLSPSDFAFLWEECKRCFYLKVVAGFGRPRGAMPRIFTVIDSRMKDFYAGMRTERMSPGLPPGVVEHGEKWVECRPISIAGRESTCYVKGKFDTVVRFDDGSYGVIDFKTSEQKPDSLRKYARQLHAYARALEDPAPGKLALSPVSRLGLLVFEPAVYAQTGTAVDLSGSVAWVEIPRDDGGFMTFLGRVLDLLDQPEPPPANPKCEWCRYRETSRRSGL